MRTTLSLDDDVAQLLEQQLRESGSTMKAEVNRLLRIGMMAAHQQQRNRPSFVVVPKALGLPAGLSYDNVAELLDLLEEKTTTTGNHKADGDGS